MSFRVVFFFWLVCVFSAQLYCTCSDITKTVTPDLKLKGTGRLLYVDLGNGKTRVGGTCLAQVRGPPTAASGIMGAVSCIRHRRRDVSCMGRRVGGW